jgi:hypothetical protein
MSTATPVTQVQLAPYFFITSTNSLLLIMSGSSALEHSQLFPVSTQSFITLTLLFESNRTSAAGKDQCRWVQERKKGCEERRKSGVEVEVPHLQV